MSSVCNAVLCASEGKSEVAPRKSVFVTEVLLIRGELVFVPAAQDFENELESIVGGFVDTISGEDGVRLLNNEELEKFTELYESETDASETATLNDIISNDEDYGKLTAGLRDAITNAFLPCDEYMQSFEKFRNMVFENEKLDPRELHEGAESGEIVLDDFKDQLEKFHSQAEEILNLPDVKECGMIEVHVHHLKEMIAPSPASCLETLEDLLPELAIIKQKRLLDQVNETNSRINHAPQAVSEFISLLDFLVECEERKEKLEEDFLELKNHYALMDSHNVKVKRNEDRAAYQLLVPEYNSMNNMLDLLDSTKDEDKGKWSQRLEEDIRLFHEEISDLKTATQDERLLEDVEDLEPILAVVGELSEHASKMQARAKDNQKFQTIFGLQIFELGV